MLSKESDEALGLANHGVNRRVAGLSTTWTFRRSAHDGVAPKTEVNPYFEAVFGGHTSGCDLPRFLSCITIEIHWCERPRFGCPV